MPMERFGRRTYSKRDTAPTDWFFSNQITITSATAVGGTTTINLFRKKYAHISYRLFLSAGELVHRFAKECGMTKDQFSRHMTENPQEKWDERIDAIQVGWGGSNNVMVESRLAHIFLPRAFHVLEICPEFVRAERRARDENLPVDQMLRKIVSRDQNNKLRYDRMYPGWNWDLDDFDLVQDTSKYSPEEIFHDIELEHERWLDKLPQNMIHHSMSAR
jgi:cytidylate kinase